MTLPQASAFAVIAAMMLLFVWGRLRYDLVAALALLAALTIGIVPAERAFTGFSSDIVVTVATALVLSAAVTRSGITERLMAPLAPRLTTVGRQVVALALVAAVLSAFVKNVAALAILLPIAIQLTRRAGTATSSVLMPLSFASLLGGLTTLIGTAPNIIIADMREDLVGAPFRMFDFTPVGAGIAVAGVVYLALGYRLLPGGRRGASAAQAFSIEGYTTEARVPTGSPIDGATVAALEALAQGEVTVTAVDRGDTRHFAPAGRWPLRAGDVLILQGEDAALQRVVARAKLELPTERRRPGQPDGEIGVLEAVVTPASPLVSRTAAEVGLRAHHQVNLVAVSRSGARLTQRLRALPLQAGDVVVLQGDLETLPETLAALGCLPLAPRPVALGRKPGSWLPVLLLAAAMLLVALDLVPVAVAFFGAAVLTLLLGTLRLREAYDSVEAPILVLLGCLIPVTEALHRTGAADLLAGWLAATATGLPPIGILALILVGAMALTPFMNNAATVLILAPVAVGLSQRFELNPDPFLLAVAIGAGCDFLTPIGHQCNTLVMGPGGYRFGDYWKLGLPLSLIVVAVGVPLIAVVWPLAPAAVPG